MRRFFKLTCYSLFALLSLTLLNQQVAFAQNRMQWKMNFKALGREIKQAQLQGDLDLAEKLARERLKLSLDGPEKAQAVASVGLGAVLRNKGLYAESEVLFRKGIEINQHTSDPAGPTFELKSRINLANSVQSQGRYAQANALLKQALDIAQSDPTNIKPGDLILARTELAKNLIDLEQYQQADALLQKAISTPLANTEDLSNETDDSDTGINQPTFRLAQSYHQLGILKIRQHELAQAEAAFKKAESLYAQIMTSQQIQVMKTRLSLAKVQLLRDNPESAQKLLEPLLIDARNALGSTHPFTAKVEVALAQSLPEPQTQDKLKLYAHAQSVFQQSGALEETLKSAAPYASLLKKTQQPLHALEVYLQALDAVDALFAQSRGLSDDTRESLVQTYNPLYKQCLELLLTLNSKHPDSGYAQQALAVASRNQSRLFTEMLRQADVNSMQGNSDFLNQKTQYQDAKFELARLQEVLYARVPTDGEMSAQNLTSDPIVAARIRNYQAALESQVESAKKELKRTEDALWQHYPRFMELTRPRPVNLSTLQNKVLKPGETLISYTILADRLLIFGIQKNQFQMWQQTVKSKKLFELIEQARSAEEQPENNLQGLSKLEPSTLYALYQTLFEPVAQFADQSEKILIVGDGPLFTLPFEMLITRWNQSDQQQFEGIRQQKPNTLLEYGSLHYLGDQHAFAYLPSLSSLLSLRLYRKENTSYTQEFTSFSNPDFERPNAAENRSLKANSNQNRNLSSGSALFIPPLPETELEAKEIAGILGGKNQLYLGDKAQEYTVKNIDLSHTRFLHFATHGLVGAESAMLKHETGHASTSAQPALLLSLSGPLQGEDGLLSMGEVVSQLNLNAKLVVLSACNTASGSDLAQGGEGFAGLTRAFMYAGAQGLLVSQWSVESTSTQQLMAKTFEGIKQGQSSLSALLKAREELRRHPLILGLRGVSQQHPYFWAPFVYVGD